MLFNFKFCPARSLRSLISAIGRALSQGEQRLCLGAKKMVGKRRRAYDIASQANEREFLVHETSPPGEISPPISTAASGEVYARGTARCCI